MSDQTKTNTSTGDAARLVCTTCGYDARGLALGCNCPECGTALTTTYARTDLTWASPRWIGRVRLGLALVLVALTGAIAELLLQIAWHAASLSQWLADSLPIEFVAMWFYEDLHPLWVGSLAAIAFAGFMFGTTREPGVPRHGRLRVGVRVLAWLDLAVSAALVLIVIARVPDTPISIVQVLTIDAAVPIVSAITLLLFARHTAQLLKRHNDARSSALTYGSATYAIAFVIVSLTILLVVVTDRTPDAVWQMWDGLMLVAHGAVLACAVWFWTGLRSGYVQLGNARRAIAPNPPGALSDGAA